MDRLLKPHEVREILGITRPTMLMLVKSKAIKSVRVGERNRFRVADIEAYLDRKLEGE